LNLEILDYSSILNALGNESDLLRAKFLQLEHEKTVIILIGAVSEYPYHASLLERFCRDQQIPSTWIKKPDVLETYDRLLDTLGGGWMLIDPTARRLEIFGASSAYGGYDRRIMNDLAVSHPQLRDWQINVEA
jgi:hypothetical protein